MGHPFGSVLGLSPPGCWGTSRPLAGRAAPGAGKALALCKAAQKQLKCQRAISIVLILNTKHGTTPVPGKKINSIPAKSRIFAFIYLYLTDSETSTLTRRAQCYCKIKPDSYFSNSDTSEEHDFLYAPWKMNTFLIFVENQVRLTPYDV